MTHTPIICVRQLNFPWETADPFLFCVHHEDFFPKGEEDFGPDPALLEWKMNGQGEYVVGMESGTNRADGRSLERKEGRLIFLEPGETRSYNLEIGVLSSQEEIAAFQKKILPIKTLKG